MGIRKILVSKEKEEEEKWTFLVEYDGREYRVVVDKKYWEKLTEKKTEPEELVKKSFEFLLEHEPKELISLKFSLQEINQYFPIYETEIIKKI